MLFGLTLWLGCGVGPRRSNVLLITFDTTRADVIGAYGNARGHTPNVDSLAREGALFTNAHAHIPLTLPSHTSILSGLYPTGHGIRDNGLFVLSDEILTLPEMLKEHGYVTAGAISGFPLVKRFNLGQGFDLFDDDLRRKDEDFLGRRQRKASLFFEERRAAQTNEAVLPWLEQHQDEPFFVWLHYYDPHRPWDPPPPYDELYADDPYLAEIAYADESLGQILGKLREWGVFDETMVVFTADHGEGLGEHDESTHSLLNYETTLHVPLIIKPPGGMEPRIVADLVASVDIVPTVLDVLGVEHPDSLQGYSLNAYLSAGGDSADGEGGGIPANRQLYSETLSPRLSHGWGELRTLYQGDWKYIHGSRPELYDLTRDLDERRNLLPTESERAATMRQALARFINDNAMSTAGGAQPVDEETKAQLMALGYISGGADSGPIIEELRDDGIPPQDRVIDISLSSEARSLITAGRGSAARQVISELLGRDPENPFYRELLVQADLILGQLPRAADTVESLIADPRGRGASAGILIAVGSRLVATGAVERGLALVRRAVELEGGAENQYHLSSALRQAGDLEGSYEALVATLDADPKHVRARVDLAIRHAVSGESDLARDAFEQALNNDPFYAKGHYNYGAFLLEGGDPVAALERFERATAIDRGYRAAYLARVATALELSDEHRAGVAFAELEAVAPNSEETQRARQLLLNSAAPS